jgi:hypothetical protein
MPKKTSGRRGSSDSRPAGRKRRSFDEKRKWVLDRLEKKWEFELRTTIEGHYAPFLSPSEEADEEAWHKEFGGYRKYHLMGNHVSPDFAKTLRKMLENGTLLRKTLGNQGAREGGYAMKTYSVYYASKKHHFQAKLLRGES